MDVSENLELKISLINKQSCFSKLTSDEAKKLAELLIETCFKIGEIIVTEGEHVDSVYLIVDGKADVRHSYVKNGIIESKSIATIGPGESIGLNETGFYSLSGRRTATVVALTPVISLKLNIAEFHGFALTYSHVNEVMRKNSEEIDGSS